MELPTIPQFYKNKNIFITGGSGFIGKILIEKLLRSCPDLKKIYLLLREKKGQSPEERIKSIADLPLFDILRSQNPKFSTKIEIIKGDVKELGLGLSSEDRKKLIEEVNIVFHGAASVRFDDSLTDAVILNTRGTREVTELALEMKNLDVLVHISTAYCNCDNKVVEERLYPPHADWKKTIKIAENIDRHTLNVLTEKYIHPLPNTYTFAKSLAEHVVHDMCQGRIPAVIVRPTVVVPPVSEPLPGWLDNFNGPISLLIAGGKGIKCIAYGDPEIEVDYIPADITVKALIIASWKQATNKDIIERLSLRFYNCSSFDPSVTKNKDLVEMGEILVWETPFKNVAWYPSGCSTKCYYYFLIKFFMCDLFFAIVCDGLLLLFGKKTMLIKIQRKIYVASLALSHFMFNQWKFLNDKCYNLQNELLPRDVHSFSYNEEDFDVLDYYRKAFLGASKYLLKEEAEDFEVAKRKMFRLWVLSKVFNFLWYLGFVWFIFIKMDGASIALDKCNKFFTYVMTPFLE